MSEGGAVEWSGRRREVAGGYYSREYVCAWTRCRQLRSVDSHHVGASISAATNPLPPAALSQYAMLVIPQLSFTSHKHLTLPTPPPLRQRRPLLPSPEAIQRGNALAICGLLPSRSEDQQSSAEESVDTHSYSSSQVMSSSLQEGRCPNSKPATSIMLTPC